MNKWIWGAIIIIILATGALYIFGIKPAEPAQSEASSDSAQESWGSYAYECDGGVAFTMTPSADMSAIVIAPAAGASYPASATLAKADASSGVRYEGGGYVFTGKGESVVLTGSGESINCSPIPDPENAPFNFGD
jgi:membrane-bound inhibitor of C-type lysozyme